MITNAIVTDTAEALTFVLTVSLIGIVYGFVVSLIFLKLMGIKGGRDCKTKEREQRR
jgi:hypothetical protein